MWPQPSPSGPRLLHAGGTGRLAFGIAEGKAGGQIGARAHGESEALYAEASGTIISTEVLPLPSPLRLCPKKGK